MQGARNRTGEMPYLSHPARSVELALAGALGQNRTVIAGSAIRCPIH